MKKSSNDYDAIIIGAGIGGLVCGCYLAKAGMKVLIAEQHDKPGGYCTSFKRREFLFDAGPHCFGSYRKNGISNKIFKELAIDNKLKIIRPNPSDIITMPDYSIPFWNDLDKTIMEFQSVFPRERNINKFFYLLLDTNPQSFSKLRNITFNNLVNQYFKNDKLKATLLLPLLSINGVSPSLVSAFVGAKLYSEFLIDGGYYPEGGMKAIPNALVERFREFGGQLQLSCIAKRIRMKNNTVTGLFLDKLGFVQSKYVVSDCDARQTFLKLLGKEKLDLEFYRKLKNMIPSLSNFIAYLGLSKHFKTTQNPGTALYFYSHYDVENAYQYIKKGNFNGYGSYAFRISHDKSTIFAGMPAPFKTKLYWQNNKYKLLDYFINTLEKYSLPNLSKYIVYKDAATPITLHRYTSNYKGSSYGWAGTISQFAVPNFRKPTFVQNLFLTGHWSTLGVGISGTANIGYDTAKIILRKK